MIKGGNHKLVVALGGSRPDPDAVSDDIKSFIDDYSKSFPETNPTRHRHRHRPTNCHFIIVHYVSFH